MNKQEALEKIKELESYIENLDNPTYRIGDRFYLHGDKYILCCVVPNNINLINLKSGDRWNSRSVEVNNTESITNTEFKKLTGNYDFKKLEK